MRDLLSARFLSRLAALGLAALFAVSTGLSTTALAAVPTAMTVEGALYSSGGGPAADGSYNVVFSLYKDLNGGTPVWTEGPVAIAVKGGLFTYTLGTKTPLTAAVLADLPTTFFGVKIDADAELPRSPVHSVAYALRSQVAHGLECSGCVTVGQIDPNVLSGYAKTTSLAKSATSGNYADLIGVPDLGVYAKLANLAAVAASGQYGDLIGAPDLTGLAKMADLANVAISGKYGDLSGIPTMAKVDTACGTGLVVKGIKADGTLDCTAGGGAIDPKNLPADGIDEISNGLIHDQFVDSIGGTANVDIADNKPIGTTDTLDFPDIGLAQKLTVSVDLVNSNVGQVTVSVIDPNKVEYILYTKSATGTKLVGTYPDPNAVAKGDLTTWVGKNPKGAWTLKVIDSEFMNNTVDGKINKWSVNLQTLSNKKIQVKGNVIVDGSIQFGTDNAPCTPAKAGAIRWIGTNFQGCNGSVWTGLQGPDGSSKVAASQSCKTIRAAYPASPDGVYWLDPNGGDPADAFQAVCDMTRDGGGWTLGVKTWYQAGVTGNAGAMGAVGDGLTLKGTGYKLSDAAIKDIIGSDNNFDVLLDQAGYNSSYSGGNYEYFVIKNYTAVWTFAGNVKPSSTTTSMYSYRLADNKLAWSGNFGCGDVGGWGINCYNVTAGANPAGGSGCGISMSGSNNGGWHHVYMAETNTDSYLYVCNGAQHSSGHNMNHRAWFR